MVETIKSDCGIVHVCKDSGELGDATARDFIRILQEAIGKRGRATVALSGGHTPKILYDRVLKEDLKNSIDWSRVHFWVGDERTVPEQSDESNFGNAKRQFLSVLNLPAANLHQPKEPDKNPQACAADYEKQLVDFFGLTNGQMPVFDIIFLGMGPDGHTASLFPGTAALQEKTKRVVANHVDKLKTDRITFTFPVLNAARNIVLMVEGAEKAPVLAQVLQSNTKTYPVQNLNPVNGRLDWFIDAAAVEGLKSRHS